MKIWVTGGSGALGQELVKVLERDFPTATLLAPTSQELNLEDAKAVNDFVRLNKPTHVYHLAARVFGIGGHTKTPEASLLSNTRIDNNVFTPLFENPPIWIYYASTVAAYGYPYVVLPLSEKDWLSSEPHESEYGYAMSKRLAIAYLELLSKRRNVKFVYGLSTNLFGRGDRFLNGGGHVMVSLLEKAKSAQKEDKPLSVWGEPSSSRDFLSTRSAAEIISELTNQDIGIVNIASGTEISIETIAKLICGIFALEKGYEFTHEMQGIPNRYCDSTKLRKYSKYACSVNSLEEIESEIYIAAKN